MENLAGVTGCDSSIKDELFLAGIQSYKESAERSEVPYNYVGKIGKWKLTRAWYYWVVRVENREDGLILEEAIKLHNIQHPTKDSNIGLEIRAGGHAGAESPEHYGADPVYNEELNEKLMALGYEEKELKLGDEITKYVPITVGEISQLNREGKLDVDFFVDCYHIDTQIGLKVFADFMKFINLAE